MVLIFHNKKMLAAGYIHIQQPKPIANMRQSQYHRFRRGFGCFALFSAFIPPFVFGIVSVYYHWKARGLSNNACDKEAETSNNKSINWATAGYISGLIIYWTVLVVAALFAYAIIDWPTSELTKPYGYLNITSTAVSPIITSEIKQEEINERNRKRCIAAKRNLLLLREPEMIKMIQRMNPKIRTDQCTFNDTRRGVTIVGVPLCDALWNMESWSNHSRPVCDRLGINLPDISPFSREFESRTKDCPVMDESKTHYYNPFCRTRFYFTIPIYSKGNRAPYTV